jgi:nicotinamidase-related amidase
VKACRCDRELLVPSHLHFSLRSTDCFPAKDSADAPLFPGGEHAGRLLPRAVKAAHHRPLGDPEGVRRLGVREPGHVDGDWDALGVGAGDFLIEATWNTDIVEELAPQPADVLVSKHRYSGFFETELDDILRARGVKNLIFVGWTTSVSVESTLRDAFFRDYRCVLLSDCTAEVVGSDLSRTNHEASLLVVEAPFGWVAESESLVQALERAQLVPAPAR